MPHKWLCNQWSLPIQWSISYAVLRCRIRTPSCVSTDKYRNNQNLQGSCSSYYFGSWLSTHWHSWAQSLTTGPLAWWPHLQGFLILNLVTSIFEPSRSLMVLGTLASPLALGYLNLNLVYSTYWHVRVLSLTNGSLMAPQSLWLDPSKLLQWVSFIKCALRPHQLKTLTITSVVCIAQGSATINLRFYIKGV